jgi:hypothetical protein
MIYCPFFWRIFFFIGNKYYLVKIGGEVVLFIWHPIYYIYKYVYLYQLF